MPSPDPIIIIGAGHNGLTAAAYLAKAGRKVIVLERRASPGGIAATEAILPGYHFNTGFANTAAFLDRISADLGLHQHGLVHIQPETALFAPTPGGGLAFDGEGRVSFGQAALRHPADAERLVEFAAFLKRMTGVLVEMLALTPPELKGPWTLRDLWPWARVALQVKGLGEREMMDFVRILPMSAREFLDEWFTGDELKGAFALLSTIGVHLGPMGAGTTLNLLYHCLGGLAPRFAAGGAGALSAALRKAVEGFGGQVLLESEVARILVENGRAAGVELVNGERLPGARVVSSLDPGTTLLSLAGARYLPVQFTRRLSKIRYRGSTATVHFALDRLPSLGAPDRFLTGWIALAPSLADVERAYDDLKYGRISRHPALLATIPSLLDPTLAPAGKHTLTAVVRYAPHTLKEGDWSVLADRAAAALRVFDPSFDEAVIAHQALTPVDYAQDYRLPEGAWTHGQLGLDQMLFMRPVPGWAEYRTPIDGLILCGSGCHPGGGITGAPGYNAARTILQE